MPEEGILGLVIGFGLVVVLPLVGMLLSHQRRMAELLRQDQMKLPDQSAARLDKLEGDVAEIKSMLTDHVLKLDDQRTLRQRIGEQVDR